MDYYIIAGFVLVILLIFIIKAVKVYNIYNKSIYTAVFSNFLEFYYKYRYKKNLSISYWFTQEIGYHKIIYNNHISKTDKFNQLFITVIHKFGVNTFLILSSNTINISKATFAIKNQSNYQIKNYNLDSNIAILVPNKNDINITNCKYQVDNYNNIINVLKSNGSSLDINEINNIYDNMNISFKGAK